MTHFLVEQKSLSAMRTDFPHSPTDDAASFTDYVEDKLANGWRVVSHTDASNGFWFVFASEARP